jgi:hypothetical protein
MVVLLSRQYARTLRGFDRFQVNFPAFDGILAIEW